MDRERLRVVVSEALQKAVSEANAGNLGVACETLAVVERAVASAHATQQSEPLALRLLETVGLAQRRLVRAQRALQTSQQAGGAVADKAPSVAPLRPRTFSVALPLSPTRSEHSLSPLGHNNPLFLSYSSPQQGGSAAESPPAVHTHSTLRRGAHHHRKLNGELPFPLTSSADPPLPPDSPLSMGYHQLGSGLPPKQLPLPIRFFGSVSLAAGAKRGGRGSMLRGRPRLQPPVLMPLHAPPTAATGAGVPPLLLAAIPPLAPAGSATQLAQGSYESWLCRLLRLPLKPLPLPDELIMHILSFVQPDLLFHATLTLPTLVVDKATTVRGHHATIASALRVALPGGRILVRPGVYRESLSIDVPVAIIGCGAPGGAGVTITSSRNHTIHSTAPFARLSKVLLRQTGASGRSCLLCSRGTLEVSECDVSSASGLCIEATNGAAPIVRHSRVHSGAAAGLWFRAGAGGLVEGNEIWGNGWSGVQISEGANPTLLRNFIHDNKSAGLISFNHGRGVALQNDITANGKGGVQVRSRACPQLSGNRIFAERSFGVWVYEQGLGHFENNDIVNNAWSGFQVEEGSAPVVVGNRLRGNRSAGIVVYNRGSGTYEWNDISANGRCGVQIKSGSAPVFRHNRIHHERQAGVLTAEVHRPLYIYVSVGRSIDLAVGLSIYPFSIDASLCVSSLSIYIYTYICICKYRVNPWEGGGGTYSAEA